MELNNLLKYKSQRYGWGLNFTLGYFFVRSMAFKCTNSTVTCLWTVTAAMKLKDACFFRASVVAQTVKNLPASAGDLGSLPGLGIFSREGNDSLTPVFLPGELHGQRSLVGYSPRGHKMLDMTEWLTLCTLEGKHIKKQRHHFANKGLSSQSYGSSSSYV